MGKKTTLLFVCSMIATFVATAQIGLVRRDFSLAPLTLEIENVDGAYDIIDWGQPTDFGPDWSDTLEAEIAWIADVGGDSLGCVPTTKDLTGKWALIRRGVCGFSLKSYHATEAGAVGYLIVNDNRAGAERAVFNMLGGDSITRTTIPGGFVPRGFGETFIDRVDAGTPVKARMAPISIWRGRVYHYPFVPEGQVRTPFNGFLDANGDPVGPHVNYFNHEEVDSVFTGTLTATYPDGTTEVLGTTNDIILPGTQELMAFPDVTILPDRGPGEYRYTFSSDLPSANDHTEVVTVTEDYWSMNEADIPSRTVGLSDQGYADSQNSFGFGSVIETDEATRLNAVQFGICNVDTLMGVGTAEVFVEVYVVDLDPNGDGVVDNPTAETIDDFDSNDIIGFAEYFLTGNETCGTKESDLITVAVTDDDDPVMLDEDGLYMVFTLIGSLSPGTIVAPSVQAGIVTGSTRWDDTALFFSKVIQTDNFSSFFFNFGDAATDPEAGYQGVGPMYRVLSGEISSTRQVLGGQLILAPNPANQTSQLRYSLQTAPENGIVEVFSMTGQKVYSQLLFGSRAGTMDLPVDALPVGMYNVRISTDAGERTLPLQVIR